MTGYQGYRDRGTSWGVSDEDASSKVAIGEPILGPGQRLPLGRLRRVRRVEWGQFFGPIRDPNPHSGSHANAHPHPDAHSDAHSLSQPHSDANSAPYADAGAHAESDANPHSNAHTDPVSDSVPDADPCTESSTGGGVSHLGDDQREVAVRE